MLVVATPEASAPVPDGSPPAVSWQEQKIDIKIFIVHSDPLLPCNEGEPIAEFEQEGFDLS